MILAYPLGKNAHKLKALDYFHRILRADLFRRRLRKSKRHLYKGFRHQIPVGYKNQHRQAILSSHQNEDSVNFDT